MRCALFVLMFALIGGSQGCATCQNGLCSPDESEAIFDPALLGEWAPLQPKPQEGEADAELGRRDAELGRVLLIPGLTAGGPEK
jgi:hypothetical protein